MRFLMQPRDLGHPEACDLLAGNPLELASSAYISAVQRAVVPDSPAYYRYRKSSWPSYWASVRRRSGSGALV
jgi:hypothetical protein